MRCVALDPQAISDDSWWRVSAPAPLEGAHDWIVTGGLAAGVGAAWLVADVAVAFGVLWVGALTLPFVLSVAATRSAFADLKHARAALEEGRLREGAAALESIARRRTASRRARAYALVSLASCMTHWGLHDRAIVLARHVAGMSGLPRTWTATSWSLVQTIAACLGDLDAALDARAHALPLAPHAVMYGDLLIAAREERWSDVLRAADGLEREATKRRARVSSWLAIFRAYAMHRCEMDPQDVEEVLATIPPTARDHANAIPAWPELRAFVEQHVDSRPGAGSTP